jgi:hypothetical protein
MENIDLELMKKELFDTDYSLKMLDYLYYKLKKNSKKYYLEGEMTNYYLNLKQKVLNFEHKLSLDYICDTKIDYRNIKDINPYSKTSSLKYEVEDILDFIVNYARQSLINGDDVKEKYDILDVSNECNVSSSKVSYICNQLCVSCERLKIDAGYDFNARLYNGAGYHYFNIVTISDKKYLVDCTYKQFFKTDKASLERLGIPLFCPPYPGTFMLLDEKRKEVAKTILKQGWIEATDENLKCYFDGFTISFRNGLYYENLGKISYDTDYTVEDYIRFIKGSDSQLKHENEECLGFQRKPLEDYTLKFKK